MTADVFGKNPSSDCAPFFKKLFSVIIGKHFEYACTLPVSFEQLSAQQQQLTSTMREIGAEKKLPPPYIQFLNEACRVNELKFATLSAEANQQTISEFLMKNPATMTRVELDKLLKAKGVSIIEIETMMARFQLKQ